MDSIATRETNMMNTSDFSMQFDVGMFEVQRLFNQLELSYRESKSENEILWEVLMEFGNGLVWDKLFLTFTDYHKGKNILVLLKQIEGLLSHGKHDIAFSGLRHLLKNYNQEVLSDFELISLGNILDQLFTVTLTNLDDMEQLYIDILVWMRQAADSPLRKSVHVFLQQNHDKLNRITADTNSPEVILAFLYNLLTYEMESPLRDGMKYVLDMEWPFLDANIVKEQFARFLWMCSYLSIDDVLLKVSKESANFLNQDQLPEISLYKTFRDMNSKRGFTKKALNELALLMSQGRLFDEKTKDKLWGKIVEDLQAPQESSVSNETLADVMKAITIWQIKNKTIHCPHCKLSQLVRENFLVCGFGKKSNQVQKQVTFSLLTCCKCKRIYAIDKMKLEMNKALAPYLCKVDLDPVEYPNTRKITGKLSNITLSPTTNDHFKWPSTDANESNGSSDREGNFRDETELHRLGYRITGLNRSQRWDVLVRRAIPKITLKEIVNTIARNVRLRKSQIGGSTKFSHAIGEWEHDLKRLKQEYYKSNFTWPTY